jgi:hypothetical protein
LLRKQLDLEVKPTARSMLARLALITLSEPSDCERPMELKILRDVIEVLTPAGSHFLVKKFYTPEGLLGRHQLKVLLAVKDDTERSVWCEYGLLLRRGLGFQHDKSTRITVDLLLNSSGAAEVEYFEKKICSGDVEAVTELSRRTESAAGKPRRVLMERGTRLMSLSLAAYERPDVPKLGYIADMEEMRAC